MVLRGEPQVGGQPFAVGEQALHRRRVGGTVPGGHLGDPVTGQLDQPGTGLRLQAFGVEDGPVGVLDLGLHPGRDLGQDVPRAMDETALAQGLGEGLLDRRDQPGRAVGDDQQRRGQAAVLQVGEEVTPGVGGLAAARRRPTNTGLPPVVMPQAASTGSAGEPGCIRKNEASRNR